MASKKAKKAAIMAKNSVKRMAKRLRTEGLIKGAMGGGAAPIIPESFATGVPEVGNIVPGKLNQKLGYAGGIAGMLAYMLKDVLIASHGAGIEEDLQTQAMDIQAEQATPENFLIQALLPSSEQQKQQAMQALMQQLTGGNAPRQLARGEVLT